MAKFEPTKIEDYCHPDMKSLYTALGFGTPQESRDNIHRSCGPYRNDNQTEIPDHQFGSLLNSGKGYNQEFYQSPSFPSWSYCSPKVEQLVSPQFAHLHDAVFSAGVPVANTDIDITTTVDYSWLFKEQDIHMGEGRTPRAGWTTT